jgi:hypothetical protein
MVMVGVAADNGLARAHANCGAVSSFRRFARCPVNLLQHRVINLGTEGVLDRAQICAMSICRELNAIRQPRFQIVNEMVRATGVTMTDKPARN